MHYIDKACDDSDPAKSPCRRLQPIEIMSAASGRDLKFAQELSNFG